jgi:hypothetical protein
LVLALVLVAANAFAAADPFKDVPTNHWAYASIQKAVEAKVIQGYEGLFHGKRNVTRYQLAEVVGKMLDKCAAAPAGGGADGGQVKQLENLVTEFADELALLNVKVGKLEEVCAKGPKAAAADVTPGVGGTVFTDRGNLHIGGIIKARYESRDQDETGAGLGDDDGKGYWVPESRLYLDHALTSDIKARVSYELSTAGGLEGYTGWMGAGMYPAGTMGTTAPGLLDAKLTFKMPNSESYIEFGQFQPEIGYYGGKLSNELEFIHYPLYLSVIGPSAAGVAVGNGIWWNDGFTFNFQNKEKTGKFAIGMFNGGNAGNVIDTDDDKAFYIGARFFPKAKKFSGGLWYWSETMSDFIGVGVDQEFSAMGIWFKYAKPEKFDINIEYVMPEWDFGTAGEIDEFADWLFAIRFPMQKNKTDIGIRYENMDTSDDTTWTRMTLGFRWMMDKNCHLGFDYESDSIDLTATTDTSPSRFILQAMYFF